MATTEKLRVNLINQYGDSKNVTLINPKDNLTLADVRNAFENLLASDTFLAGTEYLRQVRRAEIIVTETETLS